jgi:hypothetical protein
MDALIAQRKTLVDAS